MEYINRYLIFCFENDAHTDTRKNVHVKQCNDVLLTCLERRKGNVADSQRCNIPVVVSTSFFFFILRAFLIQPLAQEINSVVQRITSRKSCHTAKIV